ncbi:bifunctional riboflavin kinase/FAD synthetase [Fuerstiella marisgermanici]|uniref:Riboflavin biosynthesis protein n=1 Tax=Fuerstiella marisgermanici TaxID=1891926 RepID=A0A1P8WL29_9PLAN|nr:bifunctional riboflavin kinase/FAD synthetase [Fuerstiella marisgermanici]APZ94764.1 Riboflavin biosynthesis protein RibF [Fuerstiella marisgermanici]
MPFSELQVPASATRGVVTVGNFDGVHRGHRSMLAKVRDIADRASAPAVVVSFDPHPINVLKPHVNLPRLSTIAVRTQLLKQFGADEVVILPVDQQLLGMSPENFFQDVMLDRLQAVGLVEGPDFRFGKDRAGDTGVLRQLCGLHDVTLTVIDAVCLDDEMISSTRIRQLIQAGQLDAAIEMLGHSYTLSGKVVHGAGRGRTIGIPTANLADIEVLLPAAGVYAGRCCLDGQTFSAAVNIGSNPTFGDDEQKVECHVIDYSGDLYGQNMDVELLAKIRDAQQFANAEALTNAIKRDIERCRLSASE